MLLSFLRTADTEQAQHTQLMTKSPARRIRWSPRGPRVIFALHCRWGFKMNEIRSFYLLIEASRMCSGAWIPAASGPSCRHPQSCSLERFLTKFCFSLMNSSKCATEPGSFFGQCVWEIGSVWFTCQRWSRPTPPRSHGFCTRCASSGRALYH